MVKRARVTKDFSLEIRWKHEASSSVLLVAVFDKGEEFVLDYYDTIKEAKKVAKHFRECYRVAVKEGFSLMSGFFIHRKIGYGVSVAHGLALEEPVKAFRKTLRSQYGSCRNEKKDD